MKGFTRVIVFLFFFDFLLTGFDRVVDPGFWVMGFIKRELDWTVFGLGYFGL